MSAKTCHFSFRFCFQLEQVAGLNCTLGKAQNTDPTELMRSHQLYNVYKISVCLWLGWAGTLVVTGCKHFVLPILFTNNSSTPTITLSNSTPTCTLSLFLSHTHTHTHTHTHMRMLNIHSSYTRYTVACCTVHGLLQLYPPQVMSWHSWAYAQGARVKAEGRVEGNNGSRSSYWWQEWQKWKEWLGICTQQENMGRDMCFVLCATEEKRKKERKKLVHKKNPFKLNLSVDHCQWKTAASESEWSTLHSVSGKLFFCLQSRNPNFPDICLVVRAWRTCFLFVCEELDRYMIFCLAHFQNLQQLSKVTEFNTDLNTRDRQTSSNVCLLKLKEKQ